MDWSSVKVSTKVQNGKKRMIRMKENHFFSIHVCFSDYLFTGIKTKKKKKIVGWEKYIDIWFD